MPDFTISVSGNVSIAVLLILLYLHWNGVTSLPSWCSWLLGVWRNLPSEHDQQETRDQDSSGGDNSSDA